MVASQGGDTTEVHTYTKPESVQLQTENIQMVDMYSN